MTRIYEATKGRAWPEVDIHGIRNTFADWCRDTGEDELLGRIALDHTVGDKTSSAYFRSSALDRRLGLMVRWAEAVQAAMPVVSPMQAIADNAEVRALELKRYGGLE